MSSPFSIFFPYQEETQRQGHLRGQEGRVSKAYGGRKKRRPLPSKGQGLFSPPPKRLWKRGSRISWRSMRSSSARTDCSSLQTWRRKGSRTPVFWTTNAIWQRKQSRSLTSAGKPGTAISDGLPILWRAISKESSPMPPTECLHPRQREQAT